MPFPGTLGVKLRVPPSTGWPLHTAVITELLAFEKNCHWVAPGFGSGREDTALFRLRRVNLREYGVWTGFHVICLYLTDSLYTGPSLENGTR
jgi:hypothetical protein